MADKIDNILGILLGPTTGKAALTPYQRRALEAFTVVVSSAAMDARAGGVGYLMMMPDGEIRRLDPHDVMRRQEQTGYQKTR